FKAGTTTISDKGNNTRSRAPEDDKSLHVETGENGENVETGEKMENVKNGAEVDSNKNVESAEDGEIVEMQQEKIVNIVAPIPKVPIKSWTEFDTILESYTKATISISVFAGRMHRQHTTEITRMKYLQVFVGATELSTVRTVPHKIRVLLANAIAKPDTNHTHSHLNTRTDAPSYMTTKTSLIDEQDREDLKELADDRASSKQITDFLNDRIGEKA
ncbi:hypothetical protein F442_22576, partial [Phytophthora nicotianae P10297]